MKALLENRFAPVTWTCGFVERSFADFSGEFTAWQQHIHAKSGTRNEQLIFNGPLPEALLQLEPLTTPLDRYLLIETCSNWSAIFANGLRVNDVVSPVAHLSQILKCRGLNVVCAPDRSKIRAKHALQIYGAISFTLYGPEKTNWLNRIRHVGIANDVGGWEFMVEGTIQPYENIENYRKRKIVDRFTAEMLESYCSALGIHLFDEGFYRGGMPCFVCQDCNARSSHDNCGGEVPALSLAESQAFQFIQRLTTNNFLTPPAW